MVVSGNLGSDIDIRWTPNSKCIGSVSIPAKSGFGEYEKTSWLTCKILGEKAQKLADYLTKGKLVTFTGEFILEEWEKDGAKHSRPTMLVRDIQLPARDNNSAPQSSQQAPQQNQQSQQGQQYQQSSQRQSAPQNFENFDDDIPF